MMKKLLCTLLFTVLAVVFVNAQEEINVQGNTIDIVDGSPTPNLADGTDFGQVNISSSSVEQFFVIQNTGTTALTITTTVTTNPLFQITTAPASSVAAAGSTTIGITYNAPASPAVTNAQLFIFNSDSDEGTYDFNITAEAVAPTGPEINVTGNGLSIAGNGSNVATTADGTDFGSIAAGTSSVEQFFVIENTGTLPLSVNPSFTTNPAFAVTTPAAASVVAGGSTTIGITFNAPITPGTVNSILFITNGDLDENPYQINLTGISVGPPNPEINVIGNGLNIVGDGSNTVNLSDGTDFGQIGINTSSAEQFFIIQNTGTSPLSVNPSFTTNPAFVVTTAAASSVIAGGSTTIGITFNAPGAAATVNAVLFINNDDSDENPYQINLTAEAIVPTSPEINVTGNTISIVGDGSNVANVTDGTDFGQVIANTSSPEQLFVIENTGTAALSINPSVTSNPAFSITTVAASSVIAGGSTTIGITFNSPATAGIVNATLFITNDDSDENPYQINLTGESILVAGPEIDLLDNVGAALASGGSVSFPDTDVTAGSVVYTFTIENNGTDVLTLIDPSPFVTISGTNAGDFTLTTLPASPIAASGSTTFAITFNPSGQGSRTASVTINNDDSDEGSYTFTLQGNGIDANVDSQLMITQYYEGLGANDNWIEVKNVSTTAYDSNVTSYFLAMYSGLAGTTIGGIVSSSPTESVLIPSLLPGEVALFSRNLASVPSSLGTPAQSVADEVCNFDGNDIILISTSEDDFCYDGRIDLIGEIGSTVAINWGQDISLIKGCGTTEAPSEDYTGDYITLTLEDVNNANPGTNIALGTQTVGPSEWNGTSWSNNQIPDKTKETIINGSYTNGTFESCNLTINPGATVTMSGTDYVVVDDNLTINGTFTIGDTASLITTNPTADISGSITKEESSTGLNNYRDFTYWSSPVLNPSISSVFGGVDPNRIFSWDTATSTWNFASGSMARGIGYISEAPNGATQHSVNFVGEPNNGTIPVFLRFNDDGVENTDYNLIGNPYPSAIDIRDFINLDNVEFGDVIRDNSFLGGTIYLWTHNTQISGVTSGDFIKDDYAAVNLSGGIQANSGGTIPTFFIGSGQGFFVRTTDQSGGGTRPVFFQNSMRRNDENSTPFFKSITKKSEEEQNRIWLDVVTEQGGYSQILLGFFENATDGIDRGYDGSRFSSNPIKLYSKIGDAKYAIQGLGSFDQSKSIDLGLDTRIADRTYKISISKTEGVLNSEDVYLFDNELNVMHDLKQGAYEFEVDAGNYVDRFILKFNNTVLGIDDEELNNSFVVINEENGFRLKSNSVITNLKIYDIAGRLLIDKKPGESEFTVKTSSIRKGTVLILNATLEGGAKISKKVIKY